MREAPGTHVRPVRGGCECVGPSAWDGYAAIRVADLGVEAVRSGRRVAIDHVERAAPYG